MHDSLTRFLSLDWRARAHTHTHTHTHTYAWHFCISVSNCFTLLYKNVTNHVPLLLHFSMLVNSRLCHLRLLKSCLIRHVENLFWQKSVARLHNMEYKPTFCDVSCLKDWPRRQTRNWGISSQYLFFTALQIATLTITVQDTCVSGDMTLLKQITPPWGNYF